MFMSSERPESLLEDERNRVLESARLDGAAAEQLLAEIARLRKLRGELRAWKIKAGRYRMLHRHALASLHQLALRSARMTRELKAGR